MCRLPDRQVKRSITTGDVILIYWLSSLSATHLEQLETNAAELNKKQATTWKHLNSKNKNQTRNKEGNVSHDRKLKRMRKWECFSVSVILCVSICILIARDQREKDTIFFYNFIFFLFEISTGILSLLTLPYHCVTPAIDNHRSKRIYTYILLKVWARVLPILFLSSVLLIFRFLLHYTYTRSQSVFYFW